MVADEASLWLRGRDVAKAVNAAAGWLHAEAPNPYDVFVDDPVADAHLILSAEDWSEATWADPHDESLATVQTGLSRSEDDPEIIAAAVVRLMRGRD